jgi:hypothetical protein
LYFNFVEEQPAKSRRIKSVFILHISVSWAMK